VDRAKGEEGLERHFCLPMSFIETPGKQDSLLMKRKNTCPKVQVFHSWYREKEAKT
jgi:hypothetical protein